MDKYEQLLETYQAQNAVGVARAAGAGQYAPNTPAKAERLLAEAQQMERANGSTSQVVQTARETAQTAEDARAMTVERRRREKAEQAAADVQAAREKAAQSAGEADRARMEARAAQEVAAAEREARRRAEADAAAARSQVAQLQSAPPSRQLRPDPEAAAVARQQALTDRRIRLLEQLNGAMSTRDTPRGLVVTITAAEFSGSSLNRAALSQTARIASILSANPGVRVDVEGHSDTAADAPSATRRADSVREALLGGGLPPAMVSARGLGDTRPLESNATAAGRAANQRVEIVISGTPHRNSSLLGSYL
jgi:flagellar motor protein MotB